MIKADKSKVEIKGTEKEIYCEIGVIFHAFYETVGEKRAKELILRALNVIDKDNKKQKHKNEEIKNKIKEVFPNELSDILCSLI